MNPTTHAAADQDRIVKIAVLAVGGQGGGVLSGWIAGLAERAGYHAQSTSVPGVAQRTGATVYYVEMKRRLPAHRDRLPVFSLMPAQGDVDIVIASETVEIGRALLRGFVTPDRTVLIGSSHRDLTISEKEVPGDGRKDPAQIHRAANALSREFVCFDMKALADAHGSVVSSSLFGALAGSGALPFDVEAYREVIRASGRGVDQSLAAFDAAYLRATIPELAGSGAAAGPGAAAAPELAGPTALLAEFAALQARVTEMPPAVQRMVTLGLHKAVDFQDVAYGATYLDQVDCCLLEDAAPFEFSETAAKYIAGAMVYDDIIRVADIKTRAARDMRVRREVGLPDDAVLNLTEYFHPRAEEVIGLMPRRLGAWFDARPGARRRLDRVVNRGRRVRTDRAAGFLVLWLIAGLRRWRRGLFRHAQEAGHMERWLSLAIGIRRKDRALACELLRCRRLVKGYSDTYARGHSKFDRVLGALPLVEGRKDAADWVRRLRDAALMDEKGEALDGAIPNDPGDVRQVLFDGLWVPFAREMPMADADRPCRTRLFRAMKSVRCGLTGGPPMSAMSEEPATIILTPRVPAIPANLGRFRLRLRIAGGRANRRGRRTGCLSRGVTAARQTFRTVPLLLRRVPFRALRPGRLRRVSRFQRCRWPPVPWMIAP